MDDYRSQFRNLMSRYGGGNIEQMPRFQRPQNGGFTLPGFRPGMGPPRQRVYPNFGRQPGMPSPVDGSMPGFGVTPIVPGKGQPMPGFGTNPPPPRGNPMQPIDGYPGFGDVPRGGGGTMQPIDGYPGFGDIPRGPGGGGNGGRTDFGTLPVKRRGGMF